MLKAALAMMVRSPKLLLWAKAGFRVHEVVVVPSPTTRLVTPSNRLSALLAPRRVRVPPLKCTLPTRDELAAPARFRVTLLPAPPA